SPASQPADEENVQGVGRACGRLRAIAQRVIGGRRAQPEDKGTDRTGHCHCRALRRMVARLSRRSSSLRLNWLKSWPRNERVKLGKVPHLASIHTLNYAVMLIR